MIYGVQLTTKVHYSWNYGRGVDRAISCEVSHTKVVECNQRVILEHPVDNLSASGVWISGMLGHLPAQDKAAAWCHRLLEHISHNLKGRNGMIVRDLPSLDRLIATVNQTFADMIAIIHLQLHQT